MTLVENCWFVPPLPTCVEQVRMRWRFLHHLWALVSNIYLSFFDRYHAPGLDRLPHYEWRPTPSTPPALPPHAPNVTKGRKYVMPSFIHDSWYDPCLSVSLNSSLTEELSSVGLVYLSSTFLIMEQIWYITPYDIKCNTWTHVTLISPSVHFIPV